MKINKLVSGNDARLQCAEHRHGVEAHCSVNWSAIGASVVSGGSNLYQVMGLNIRGIEHLGISPSPFDANQRAVIH